MKAIMLMFDSLNRHFLPPYGNPWVVAPNFRRLAERAVTFTNAYIGSTPCMPARRELHTGRYEFLHRGWGPLEPFDDSAVAMLGKAGVQTHLVSDHYHYWEEPCLGNYHTKYRTWEFLRGQEGDPWIGQVADPTPPANVNDRIIGDLNRQDWINRQFMTTEDDLPGPRTLKAGMEYIRRNADQDNWFLHIECFDPHEPFVAPDEYLDLYDTSEFVDRPLYDWEHYGPVGETPPEDVKQIRTRYAALLTMCDKYLGQILDLMDAKGLWDDTMLIINTDHGHLLGEHGYFAKNRMPQYTELARMPLFIWDPRCGAAGVTRDSLVQTIDLAPTLLDLFGVDRPEHMLGQPLTGTLADDTPVRDGGLFGVFGGQVNVTDGRYVYMRSSTAPEAGPLYSYTMLPWKVGRWPEPPEMEVCEGFNFTKGLPVWRITEGPRRGQNSEPNLLFDMVADPDQLNPLDDPATEKRMGELMTRLMKENDAPPEQYRRLGLAD